VTVHPSTARRPLSGWWVLPALLVVLAGTLASNHGSADHAGFAAGLAGLATLALLLAGHRPITAVLLNAGLIATYFALGYADGPVFLVLPVATFLLAVQQPLPRWAPTAAGAAALVASGLLARGVWRGDGLQKALWQSLAVAAMLAAAGAVGTAVRSRRQAAAERTQRAAAEEQLRMAQDLHDGVGHGLAVIAMQSGVALHLFDKDDLDRVAARRAVQVIRETSRESLAALRAELARLAPSAPAPVAPRRRLADLAVLVDRVRAGGLSVSLDASHDTVPENVDEAAYAIVQEALTNVLRHASADRAVVEVRADGDELLVSVTDDGQGGAVVEGLGISGMRARARRIGGSLRVGRTPDGFQVRAALPLRFPA
jgi:signal transduction histidine kinase